MEDLYGSFKKRLGNVYDVSHLRKVADAIDHKNIDVFMVFSKTEAFTAEEVETIKAGQGKYSPQLIMLSDRELEPYEVFELAQQEFEVSHGRSLENLAQGTDAIYLNPRRKV